MFASKCSVAWLIAVALCIAGLPAGAYVEVETREIADISGASLPDFNVWDTVRTQSETGRATLSYNYPTAPGWPWELIASTDDVAALRDMSAYARVNASAGFLRAYTRASLAVWGKSMKSVSLVAHAAASASIYESFVLSEAATVILTGRFHGLLGGDTVIYENPCCWRPAEASLNLSISYDDGSSESFWEGFRSTYRTKGSFEEYFSIPVYIPAGVKVDVRASLYAESSVAPNIDAILLERGITVPGGLDMVGGDTWTDLSQTATFAIQVPYGVMVSAYDEGAELFLPIQMVPEPSGILALVAGIGGLGGALLRARKGA